jgi:hypothetical protein
MGRKEKLKRENLKRETRKPVAWHDWQKDSCAYRAPDTCMSTLVGFMVGVQVVFGVVVSPVFRAGVPVVTELVLGGVAMDTRSAYPSFLLGTSLRDTYVMYPYQESPKTRALSSQECPLYIRYLVTTRICM